MKFHTKSILLLGFAVIALSGVVSCDTADSINQNIQKFDTDDEDPSVEAALERAANEVAVASGKENLGSLRLVERAYQQNSDNPDTAAAYSKALRENGYANRANIVLAPFAKKSDAKPEIQSEFASVQLSLGRYGDAEKFAVKSVRQSPSDNWQAYHLLGLSLEAQGKHIKAERAFRKALEICTGDKVPIMNNLALNLAAQGRLDESLDLLNRASQMDPNRQDIKRNIRIVQTLMESKH